MTDPCMRCTLPDCDEMSVKCEMRRLYRSYTRKINRKEKHLVTAEERLAMNWYFEVWHLERAAEASEGGRPYMRNGHVYGTGVPQ